MKVEFHPAADSELRAAAAYYQERVPGLGDEFLAEVERVCSRLSEQQSLGPRLDAEHRRLALRRFPFGLIYRLKSSKVQVVAVAHRRRRPGYWRRRR
ncbi:MAG: type II toxin-antitoxin system RelE/ParE family toxin [Steroidobacteraceae bacterium]